MPTQRIHRQRFELSRLYQGYPEHHTDRACLIYHTSPLSIEERKAVNWARSQTLLDVLALEEAYDTLRQHCRPRAATEAATMDDRLQNLPVLLSASVPESVEHSPRALALYDAITLLVRQILNAGVQLVFGGHPSIVPLVQNAARDTGRSQGVALYLMGRFRDQAPPEVHDAQVFSDIHWIGDGHKGIEEELVELREAMIAASRAAVFIGGKTETFLGPKPGVRDEYERFTRAHADAPVYLLGFLDGETARIIADLDRSGGHERNTLSDADRALLHASDDIDLIAPLLVADLEMLAHQLTKPTGS